MHAGVGVCVAVAALCLAGSALAGAFDKSKFDALKPGVTTKADVEKAVGEPTARMPSLNNHTTLIYEYQVPPEAAAKANGASQLDVVLLFDPEGKLVRVAYYTKRGDAPMQRLGGEQPTPPPQGAALFRDVVDICTEGKADPKAVFPLADQRGWFRVDPKRDERTRRIPSAIGTGVQMIGTNDRAYQGPGEPPGDEQLRYRNCFSMLIPGDTGALIKAIKAWSGFEPIHNGKFYYWIFNEEGAIHRPLKDTTQAAVKAASAQGKIGMVRLDPDGQLPSFSFGYLLPTS